LGDVEETVGADAHALDVAAIEAVLEAIGAVQRKGDDPSAVCVRRVEGAAWTDGDVGRLDQHALTVPEVEVGNLGARWKMDRDASHIGLLEDEEPAIRRQGKVARSGAVPARQRSTTQLEDLNAVVASIQDVDPADVRDNDRSGIIELADVATTLPPRSSILASNVEDLNTVSVSFGGVQVCSARVKGEAVQPEELPRSGATLSPGGHMPERESPLSHVVRIQLGRCRCERRLAGRLSGGRRG